MQLRPRVVMVTIDMFLWYTGLFVWLVIALYAIPAIPIIAFAWCGALTLRVEQWWGDRFLPDQGDGRTEEYIRLKEAGDRRTWVNITLSKLYRTFRGAGKRYETVAEAYYRVLPGV